MSAANKSGDVIQYVPFISFVDPAFWHTLTEIKLNIDKLDENTKQIYGCFTYRDDIGPVFEVDGTSFNRTPHSTIFFESVRGIIINKNTVEEFKTIDKADLLNTIGKTFCENVKNKSWIEDPSSLLNFFILAFADLKKYAYYYWFAFPSPSQPTVYICQRGRTLKEYFSEEQITALAEGHQALEKKQKSFFCVLKDNNSLSVLRLSDVLNSEDNVLSNLNSLFFGFIDPSNGSNPGWPLRLYIAALLNHCPRLAGTEIWVIALRTKVTGDINSSLYYKIAIPEDIQPIESAGCVGWERNDRGNFGPKLANMASSMDPIRLAETSADLNLKLMKWRLVPKIDLDVMKSTKCLLLGAGTLGCHVARDLLAWGFRNITFMDSGKVSYSNPVRQVLYSHQDCLHGGQKKAVAAAANMKLILPSANTKGIVAHIPMPGHPVGETLKEETIANIATITEAIEEHDLIFLLLDTREARWLPTLLAAHYGKIVINAALGFDSYLVMRHGTASEPAPADVDLTSAYIPGNQLGCYFCNDVTAPGNSLKDRTLDQQCTVTRPGVAAIAGALAVEVAVALLQHRLRVAAPAAYNLSAEIDKGLNPEAEGVLGPVPHSIRGFLWSHQTVVPTCIKFRQCIACSDVVIQQYRREGTEFLLKVFDNATYLEDITGLSELHLAAEMTDVLALSDSESEEAENAD